MTTEKQGEMRSDFYDQETAIEVAGIDAMRNADPYRHDACRVMVFYEQLKDYPVDIYVYAMDPVFGVNARYKNMEDYIAGKYHEALKHDWKKLYPGMLCGSELIVVSIDVMADGSGDPHRGVI